jgi:hypothetical protein
MALMRFDPFREIDRLGQQAIRAESKSPQAANASVQ